LSVVNSFSKQ